MCHLGGGKEIAGGHWNFFPAGFILGTPRKAYHFQAASVEEKQAWFSELHSAIFVQKRLFNKVCVYVCGTQLEMYVLCIGKDIWLRQYQD